MDKDLPHYEVEDLVSAREYLLANNNPVILSNAEGTMRYYGILVLDYIFTKLREEFPQVKKIHYNFANDQAAYDSAKKLKL